MGLVLDTGSEIKATVGDTARVSADFQRCLDAADLIDPAVLEFRCSKLTALHLLRETIATIGGTSDDPETVQKYCGVAVIGDNDIPDGIIYLMPK